MREDAGQDPMREKAGKAGEASPEGLREAYRDPLPTSCAESNSGNIWIVGVVVIVRIDPVMFVVVMIGIHMPVSYTRAQAVSQRPIGVDAGSAGPRLDRRSKVGGSTPSRIRTGDLHLERVAS